MRRVPREIVAIHEAGHAIVAEARGLAVETVSIVPDDRTHGRVNHTPVTNARSVEDFALPWAAGMAAELVVLGTHYWGGSPPGYGDEVIPREMCFQPSQHSDLAKLAALYIHFYEDHAPEHIEANMSEWVEQAAAIIRYNADAFHDLAEALTRRLTRTGDQVRAIIAGDHNED